jgi:hypothetical protein
VRRERRDVEDRARAALDHRGHERAGQLLERLHVEAHHLRLARRVGTVEQADGAEARVVADADHRLLAVEQPPHECRALLGVG